jgi:uncharacterized membrane protein
MNKMSLIFSYLLIVFIGYFIGTAIFLSAIHYLGVEYSIYTHIVVVLVSVYIAFSNRNEIIQQFKKKENKDKK